MANSTKKTKTKGKAHLPNPCLQPHHRQNKNQATDSVVVAVYEPVCSPELHDNGSIK